MLLKLIFQHQRSHPTRFVATVVALASAVSAIVWLVGGYERLFNQTDNNAQRYLGRFQAMVAPGSGPPAPTRTHSKTRGDAISPKHSSATSDDGASPRHLPPVKAVRRDDDAPTPLPRSLSDALSTSPQVQESVFYQSTRISVSSSAAHPTSVTKLMQDRAPVFGAPPLDPLLITTTDPTPLYALDVGNWLSGAGITISQSTAESLSVELGDTLRITSAKSQTEWTVDGIVIQPEDSPAIPGVTTLSTLAIYVTPAQHARIVSEPFSPSHAFLVLKNNTPAQPSVQTISESIQQLRVPFRVLDETAITKGLAQSRKLNSSKTEAWSVALLASLASLIVIGAITSTSVRERSRELAMLRAIGWTCGEVLKSLLLETLILTLIGWAIGIIAGHWLVQLLVPSTSPTYSLLPGRLTLVSSFACVAAGALLASLIPLWRASRLAPIDAMTQSTSQDNQQSFGSLPFAGVVLLLVGILANSPLAADASEKLTWVRWTAYPLLLLGIACLLPKAVRLVIEWTSPILAKFLNVDHSLLNNSLHQKSFMWAGLTFSLSIGLSILLATQIWGNSMLQTFLPGQWIPDVLIAIQLPQKDAATVPPQLWAVLEQKPDIDARSVTPLYVEQSRIVWPDGEIKTGLGADNAIIVGLDAKKAFLADKPLLDIEWLESTPDNSSEQLSAHNGCIVPEDFCIRNNLKLGDELNFNIPNNPDSLATLKIAGVVRMTGWHWLTKFSGLRNRYIRTGALIIADAEVVKNSFALPTPEFCLFNTLPGTDLRALEKSITTLAIPLLESSQTTATERQLAGSGSTNNSAAPWLRFTARDWIEDSIRIRSRQFIWAMCYLPLYTMLLFTVAVACTLFSFVKLRSWEFGVIRSLGFGKGYLLRWIAAEGLLLAILVGLTSLTFGMIAGWGGLSLARYEGFFAGPAPWVLPPREVSFGLITAVVLCGVSLLWPAWYVSTKSLLELLQCRTSSRS